MEKGDTIAVWAVVVSHNFPLRVVACWVQGGIWLLRGYADSFELDPECCMLGAGRDMAATSFSSKPHFPSSSAAYRCKFVEAVRQFL